MDLKHMLFEVKDGIAWLQFNRPKQLNAINPDVIKDLDKIVTECEANDSIKVLVLKGNEKAFAAGADIKYLVNADINEAYKFTTFAMNVQERFADIDKPTIAALSGYVFGGGCEMALLCDFRIAADNSLLGVPEINIGIIPGGGGTQRLPRLVGLGPATELIMLGEPIKADKAEKIGLVNKVVPFDQLDAEVEALAKKLMKKSSMALRSAKIAIKKGISVDLKHGLQMEQDVFAVLFGTQDQKEGMAAFVEKRKPNFQGK